MTRYSRSNEAMISAIRLRLAGIVPPAITIKPSDNRNTRQIEKRSIVEASALNGGLTSAGKSAAKFRERFEKGAVQSRLSVGSRRCVIDLINRTTE